MLEGSLEAKVSYQFGRVPCKLRIVTGRWEARLFTGSCSRKLISVTGRCSLEAKIIYWEVPWKLRLIIGRFSLEAKVSYWEVP